MDEIQNTDTIIFILEEELKPWTNKVKKITSKINTLRIYFNNHYGAKAVIDAIEFKEMLGLPVSQKETITLEHAKNYYSKTTLDNVTKNQQDLK